MKRKKEKVIVGMSGGVDSSVAVLLLQKEGYAVEGIFIDFVGGEKSERDFQSAKKIADKLKISIDKIDAREIFKEKIIDRFVADYKKGITPNPCVMCNPEMKFKILLEEANRRGIEKVATGHYSRVRREFPISNFQFPNKSQISNFKKDTEAETNEIAKKLQKAKDDDKDQSYFLYRLTQEQLARIIFPLGDYLKTQVREIADENGFKIKSKEESQDVCFIANNDFNKFISEKISNRSGEIVNNDGKILGTHNGLHFYTIGQRKGIHLGGDGPYFVIKKDIKNNRLVVSNNPTDDIFKNEFKIKDVNWIGADLKFPPEARVKIRYQAKESCAIINKMNDEESEAAGVYVIKLVESQKAITPGQSAVFYSNEGIVLGGGIII